MVKYQIVESEFSHVAKLCGSLRYDDLAEITCFGLRPFAVISKSYKKSFYRRSAFVEGEIAAMWGLSGSLLGTSEYWLLTGAAIEKIPVSFVKECKREIKHMLTFSQRFEGMFVSSYTRAQRLLEVLDFSIGPPFDHKGISVRRFWMER